MIDLFGMLFYHAREHAAIGSCVMPELIQLVTCLQPLGDAVGKVEMQLAGLRDGTWKTPLGTWSSAHKGVWGLAHKIESATRPLVPPSLYMSLLYAIPDEAQVGNWRSYISHALRDLLVRRSIIETQRNGQTLLQQWRENEETWKLPLDKKHQEEFAKMTAEMERFNAQVVEPVLTKEPDEKLRQFLVWFSTPTLEPSWKELQSWDWSGAVQLLREYDADFDAGAWRTEVEREHGVLMGQIDRPMPDNQAKPEWLTIVETSRVLNDMSDSQINRLIKDGDLISNGKAGKEKRITAESVGTYAARKLRRREDQGEHVPPPAAPPNKKQPPMDRIPGRPTVKELKERVKRMRQEHKPESHE
jgi:hypothetical protein